MGVEPKSKSAETLTQNNAPVIAWKNPPVGLTRHEVQRELLTTLTLLFQEEEPLTVINVRVLNVLQQYCGALKAGMWLLTPNGLELVPVTNGPCILTAEETKFINGVRKHKASKVGKSGFLGLPLFSHKELIGALLLKFEKQSVPYSGLEAFWNTVTQNLGQAVRQRQMSEQLRLLFDNAPDMVGIMGTDRYFKKVNPAMCEQLGYSEKELLKLSLDKLIHPDDLVVSRQRTKDFINGGNQTMYFENRFVRKSGKPLWISWTVTRSVEQGVMFCVGKNISEKKELEILLHKANELARIGGWEADLVKGTAYWSSITREIYEVPETFVPTADNWLSFYSEGQDRDYITGKMADLIATGKSCDAEVEILTALGNRRWIRTLAEAEFINGQCVRVYGSFQDIDNRKRAELAAISALEERNNILDRIGDCFFALDKNWVTTYWNTAAEQTMGKRRGEMLGENLWSQYPQAVELDFYVQYKKAMYTGKAVHFEEFFPPMQTWFRVDAYPSASGLSVFFKDITESKQVAAVLAESEKRYSDLFHLNPLPMFVYDMETLRYLDVNLAAIEHYGYTREEFLAMTILDIRPAEDIPLLKEIIAANEDQLKVHLPEVLRHRKKNGEIFRVDIQSNIIMYRDRRCKAVLAHDVTERFSYIEAIEQQNEKLKEISWMQSHVIRAPLSRILGLLPMLRMSPGDTEQQKVYDYLLASADELDRVIKSITKITDKGQVKK